MSGTLFVVSTPIGNLGDLSARARDVLASADFVACEDTRVTAKLLRRFGIQARTVSYHEHNEEQRARELVGRLERGEDIALVSDAGTPAISDPGYRLVRAAREAGIAVRAVPGPSALLAALAVSGLPTSSFLFVGFLPPRGAPRRRALEELAGARHTLVVFETPRRIGRLLSELAGLVPDRCAVLMREMTKLHEEHRAGSLAELARWAETRSGSGRGEFTLVIAGRGRRGDAPSRAGAKQPESLAPRYRALRKEGLSAREASRRLARETGLPARTVYQALAVVPGNAPVPEEGEEGEE